mmetsp:Transcript_89002/g.254830  ORF Transcript_89002/g.254830 Transcript_89002/m.254830 type:complete len:189 (-) Transcript_89002:58-624(-)
MSVPGGCIKADCTFAHSLQDLRPMQDASDNRGTIQLMQGLDSLEAPQHVEQQMFNAAYMEPSMQRKHWLHAVGKQQLGAQSTGDQYQPCVHLSGPGSRQQVLRSFAIGQSSPNHAAAVSFVSPYPIGSDQARPGQFPECPAGSASIEGPFKQIDASKANDTGRQRTTSGSCGVGHSLEPSSMSEFFCQ